MRKIEKIMFVDDEPDIRTLVDISVGATSSYKLELAENGQVLLDMVEDVKPDLILLDVRMPVMDGITALGKLREKETTKDIPVIIVTAEVLNHEIEKYKALDILGVILKPFDPMSFVQQFEEMWNKHFGE